MSASKCGWSIERNDTFLGKCCAKRSYADRPSAKRAQKAMADNGFALKPYRCPFCGMYHLTSLGVDDDR